MTEQQKADLKASEQRIKELEKALEYANVVIFSLNHLIDFAEKELVKMNVGRLCMPVW